MGVSDEKLEKKNNFFLDNGGRCGQT